MEPADRPCRHPHTWPWSPLTRVGASTLLWAQGPGSSTLSSPRFIYLSFVWGEIGENQIQRAVLAAVGGKKGMSVSPKRIPCIVALAPWLGFGRQCPSFSLYPPARPSLPAACLPLVHGPAAARLTWLLGRKRRRHLRPWLLCPPTYQAQQDFWGHAPQWPPELSLWSLTL